MSCLSTSRKCNYMGNWIIPWPFHDHGNSVLQQISPHCILKTREFISRNEKTGCSEYWLLGSRSGVSVRGARAAGVSRGGVWDGGHPSERGGHDVRHHHRPRTTLLLLCQRAGLEIHKHKHISFYIMMWISLTYSVIQLKPKIDLWTFSIHKCECQYLEIELNRIE